MRESQVGMAVRRHNGAGKGVFRSIRIDESKQAQTIAPAGTGEASDREDEFHCRNDSVFETIRPRQSITHDPPIPVLISTASAPHGPHPLPQTSHSHIHPSHTTSNLSRPPTNRTNPSRPLGHPRPKPILRLARHVLQAAHAARAGGFSALRFGAPIDCPSEIRQSCLRGNTWRWVWTAPGGERSGLEIRGYERGETYTAGFWRGGSRTRRSLSSVCGGSAGLWCVEGVSALRSGWRRIHRAVAAGTTRALARAASWNLARVHGGRV